MYHSNVQVGVSSNGLAPAPLGEHRLASPDLTLEVAPDALDYLKAQPRWYKVASLRVVKISLLGKIRASASAGVSIEDVLGALFHNHGVDAVAWSIAEAIREEISDYFPPDYTTFVRVDIRPSNARTRVTLWIATPSLKWTSALIARRSWRLMVPMIEHKIGSAYERALQGATIEIEKKSVRVRAFAPRRLLTEPVLLILLTTVLTSLIWLFFHPAFRAVLGNPQ